MIFKLLLIAYFGIASFDAWLTSKRMKAYGVDVELTPTIRRIATRTNPEIAAILGILVPATTFCGLCILFHLEWVLALFFGFRLRYFYMQLESIAFEAQLKKFKKEHPDLGGRSTESRSPLQRDPGLPGDNTMAPVNFDGEDTNGKAV